jgi:membrane protein YqaA with SNARE-associated domain
MSVWLVFLLAFAASFLGSIAALRLLRWVQTRREDREFCDYMRRHLP